MTLSHRTIAAALTVTTFAVTVEAFAQQTVAQSTIPVRSLTPAVSSDSGVLRSATIRPLSNGSVLVNDRSRRRLVMFDSTLKAMKILADTAPGAPNRYGAQVTGLLPFVGDSSIFVDNESQSLIVVDPHGMFGRIMAPPKASDLGFMASGFNSGFDEKGRAIYRVPRRTAGGGRATLPNGADGSGKQVVSVQPDSAVIVRADFDTRSVDSILTIKIPIQKMVTVSPQPGMSMGMSAFNPLPQTDEWTMLPDGTIAIVRGLDYHIDWFSNGKLTSTPKMPFDWKKVSQEEKEQLIDSLKQAAAKRDADAAANPAPAGVGRGGDAGGGRGGGGGGGGGGMTEVRVSRGGDGPPPPPGAAGMPNFPRMPFVTVDAADLPDYYPPIRAGQVRSDLEGNVWILPSTSTLSQGTILGSATAQSSSLVYDVVGRDGVVKERVKLPPGRNIAGFGPKGVVYMIYAPVFNVVYLERAHIARTGSASQ